MAIDKFRRTDVVLDKANSYILDEQFGKVGDIKGRDLVVQITNDGVIQDQSGIKLVLAWTHNQVKNTGIEPFEELNVQQGIFKVTYPAEMMNEGTVTANIGVVQENGTTFTRNFTLRVEKNAGNADAAITSDSWTVLVEALEKVNEAEQLLKDTIAGLEEKYGSSIGDMKAFRGWDPTIVAKMSNEFAVRGINVKWFGAVGDGMTDDTTAIVAAMASTADNKLFLPRGTYLISESINLNKDLYGEPGTTIKCSIAGLDYMFKLDGSSAANKKSLVVVNIKFDTQLSRGNIFCNALSSVRIEKCEFTGYDAETNYHDTDSAVMLQNVESFFGNDLYFHDHGFQYTANSGKLNRCITMQGEANKLARVDNIVIERANQGIVVECPAITMTLSNSYFTEIKDNDLYLLQLDYFSAVNSIFDDKYDESNVISYGNFNYTNCTWRDCPGRIIAINNDVTSLIVQDCNFLQTDGYFGGPIVFRDVNYRINSLIFKNNRGILYPPDGIADVFTFGQLDYFDISNNLFKLSSISDYQRLFSFRNTDNRILNGKFINNTVLPLNSANDISTKYFFIDNMKDSAYTHIYLEGNVSSKGRFSLKSGIVAANTRVLPSTGPYGFDVKIKSHLSSDYYPTIGTWEAGTIVWNEAPTAANKTLCWLRITNGDNNLLGTDWLAVKGN